MKRTLLIAGGILLAAGAAYAGGLSDTIVEMAPPAPVDPVADAGGSVPGWVIPVVIIGLLIGLASSTTEDDGGSTCLGN